jgi:hypothetical protein
MFMLQMQLWRVIFNLYKNLFQLRKCLCLFFMGISAFANAQKIENIYVNLYTDSLKKGTYNYINIDGKLDNGRYLPLDSSEIIFTASDGKFFGNQLWIDPSFSKEKVSIQAVLRSNPALHKEFDIYIKKIPNPVKLKSEDDIFSEMKTNSKAPRKSIKSGSAFYL